MADVLERVANERDDMVVGEAVHDVAPLPAAIDEVFLVEQPKTMGHGGGVLTRSLRDLADAQLPCSEQLQRAQARLVGERAKEPNRSAHLRIGKLSAGRPVMLLGRAAWSVI